MIGLPIFLATNIHISSTSGMFFSCEHVSETGLWCVKATISTQQSGCVVGSKVGDTEQKPITNHENESCIFYHFRIFPQSRVVHFSFHVFPPCFWCLCFFYICFHDSFALQNNTIVGGFSPTPLNKIWSWTWIHLPQFPGWKQKHVWSFTT